MEAAILFLLPLFFFILDLIVCLCIKQRINPFIRIIPELIILFVYPYIFISIMSSEISGFLPHIFSAVLFIICGLCIISYFILSYHTRLYHIQQKIIYSLLAIGILINMIIMIILLKNDMELGLLMASIGNLPIILAFSSAILYKYQQDKLSESIDQYFS